MGSHPNSSSYCLAAASSGWSKARANCAIAKFELYRKVPSAAAMLVFAACSSQMGSSGCGDDPTLLLAALQTHIGSWEGTRSVETKCYQAPGKFMPYLTDADDETRIGSDVYSVSGGTAWNP